MPLLTIECSNFRTSAGHALVLVWNDADQFRSDDGSAFRSQKVSVAEGMTRVVFDDLPPGDYAVAVLHDENENDELDVTPFLQLPTEGLAYSNNPKMGLKGPSWDACVFSLADDTTLPLRLKYWR